MCVKVEHRAKSPILHWRHLCPSEAGAASGAGGEMLEATGCLLAFHYGLCIEGKHGLLFCSAHLKGAEGGESGEQNVCRLTEMEMREHGL